MRQHAMTGCVMLSGQATGFTLTAQRSHKSLCTVSDSALSGLFISKSIRWAAPIADIFTPFQGSIAEYNDSTSSHVKLSNYPLIHPLHYSSSPHFLKKLISFYIKQFWSIFAINETI